MLNELLVFEDEKKILDFKFSYNNLIMWPFIRYRVYQSALNQLNNLQRCSSKSYELTFKSLVNLVTKSLIKSPFFSTKKDIVIFYNDGSNIKSENKYFNRLYGHFAELFKDDTLLIENFNENLFHHEPNVFNNLKYEDLLNILVSLKSKVRYNINSEDIKEANELIRYLKEHFPYKFSDEFYLELKDEILKLSVKIRYYYYYYKKLFLKISPKIVFFECGCYGERAYAIKIANEMGIQTAEFQHGLVSLNHTTYNYGTAIFNSREYQEYMPKYYLTYGQYWANNIRVPIKKIIIGSPHFTCKLRNYTNKSNNNKIKNILIVSQGTVTNLLVQLTKELSSKLEGKDYRIIYRLHPGEVTFKERYATLKNYDNVSISNSGDIFDLICQSDFIVGVSSTTLFESIGFNKPIFVYDHVDSREHVSKSLGIWFKNSDELFDLITQKEKINTENNSSYYWEDNWEYNYKSFINKTLSKYK